MQTGFLLDTAFDVSPTLIGTRVNNVLIRSFDEIGDYFAACHPDVAVLTVPKHIAQEVAEQLVAFGVRGIWNFTNTELHVGARSSPRTSTLPTSAHAELPHLQDLRRGGGGRSQTVKRPIALARIAPRSDGARHRRPWPQGETAATR